MADTLVLGTSTQVCEFESHHGHQLCYCDGMADMGDLKSPVRENVWVQVPPVAPEVGSHPNDVSVSVYLTENDNAC